MNININNDFDKNLKQLDEMLEKIQLLEDKSKLLNFITIKQFSELRGCSVKVAQDIFNEQSFPSENYGKQKVVEISALKAWYMNKHDKNNKC